ncbi:MAG: M18 family aminopeptidase [Candidatus Nitronauta litoralis]|uniref:M18 family aminopeptidase n=1 Tax=Candidatus Nitronauta litoralis TaxID=2705533 RepID=A0A7T0FZ39_9BACT|nr:MAG: M18 family aminopeptidase [Candidatus Nitronauta litoralis]
MKLTKIELKKTDQLLKFIDRSPTPFHAVNELGNLLGEAGFERIWEEDSWNLKKGGCYFLTRNESSLIAFAVGTKPVEENGFCIVGAHTDSPNLRLKPNPVYDNAGYTQLGVEVYGGALLGTWTDRDLGLSGRLVIKSKTRGTESRLIKIDSPLLRIPQLAIHLNRNVNEKGLLLNAQQHLPPVFGLTGAGNKLEQDFRELIAREAKVKSAEILGVDLMLHDIQPSAIGGPNDEFIFAPRLDNLASCHAATLALIEAPKKTAATRVLAFYDNEEVGSETAQGGASPFLSDTLERLTLGTEDPRQAYMRAVAQSFFISADMAHAVHPNYADMHDSRHWPAINSGPVIKTNAGQRYATDGETGARFSTLCQKAEIPVQQFAMRSDLRCGSTIGPITAANLGIRTVDIGNPMLSMHSIREMAGTKDHPALIRVFKEFFKGEF